MRNDLLSCKFLIEAGRESASPKFSIDQRDDNGNSPFLLAVAEGHEALVDYFLAVGCNPNSANNNKETALHLAARRPHLNILQILIRNENVNKEARDINGNTPLLAACVSGSFEAVSLMLSDVRTCTSQLFYYYYYYSLFTFSSSLILEATQEEG
jgi:ankyrin repeat protein